MTGDPRWALRQSLLSVYRADVPLQALIAQRVYDEVREDPTFPFVVLDTMAMSLSEFLSKSVNSSDVLVSVYAWSTYQGYKEVEQILGAVYDATHQVLHTVAGFDTILCRFENSEEGRVDGSPTRWGVSRFRLSLEVSA
jgi:hypothetical protein